MDYPICNSLLLVYKRAIKLYVDAEQNIAERSIKGDLGEDYKAALEEAERLRLASRDASDAFVEHWQQDHSVSHMPLLLLHSHHACRNCDQLLPPNLEYEHAVRLSAVVSGHRAHVRAGASVSLVVPAVHIPDAVDVGNHVLGWHCL